MKMRSTIPRIVEERTDETRQKLSQKKLLALPTVNISVEGKNDKIWLDDLIAKKKGDIRYVVTFERDDGKREVIKRVESGLSKYGIVDMDSDFSGTKTSSDSLCDTRGWCCTFGAIYHNLNEQQKKEIILGAINHRKDVKNFIGGSSSKLDELEKITKKATKLRLFCAWAKKPQLSWQMPSNYNTSLSKQWYDYVWGTKLGHSLNLHDFLKQYRDLEISDLWLEFENKYGGKLHQSGINDHDLEMCINAWLEKKQFKDEENKEKPMIISHNNWNNAILKYKMNENNCPEELLKHLNSWGIIDEL
jgi:hypothetical protein